MAEPPVPVLMLYDPEEFWAKVHATVREEMAAVHAGYNGFQSAIEKAGLPIKPAYSMSAASYSEFLSRFSTRGRFMVFSAPPASAASSTSSIPT
jgi:hypothetical protein